MKFFLDAGEDFEGGPALQGQFLHASQARVRADRQGRQSSTNTARNWCPASRPSRRAGHSPGPRGVPRHVGQRQAAGELRYGQSPDPGPQSGLWRSWADMEPGRCRGRPRAGACSTWRRPTRIQIAAYHLPFPSTGLHLQAWRRLRDSTRPIGSRCCCSYSLHATTRKATFAVVRKFLP